MDRRAGAGAEVGNKAASGRLLRGPQPLTCCACGLLGPGAPEHVSVFPAVSLTSQELKLLAL